MFKSERTGIFWFDECDQELAFAHRWRVYCDRGIWYVQRRNIETNKLVYFHREVLQAPKGKIVDHIDGNGLNNKRENLRICTIAENSRNARIPRMKKSSRYKGVTLDGARWKAQIHCNGKHICLGRYNHEKSAAKAYNLAAEKLFGEFARINVL